jgi:gas vesicle protein
MSSTDDPRQLRREIEYTQRNLSADVDALTEKVTPSRIVQRRADRVRRRFTGLRDKVMGSAAETTSTAGRQTGAAMSTVADRTSSAVSSAAEAAGEAPQAIRRGTEGNPLAAGLIAFGLGWLTASLLPASKPEQRLADRATDLAREHSEQLGQVATQVRDNLREPAQQAVEAVKSTAQDAAGTVTDETRSAAGTVSERVQDAKSTVQQHSSSGD